MRSTPMTVAEGCNLQKRMLEHFNLVPTHMTAAEAMQPAKSKRLSRKAVQALEVSDVFLQLMDDPITHGIRTSADAVQEIRYSLGFSWLAWWLARQFISMLIRWLWDQYHSEPS